MADDSGLVDPVLVDIGRLAVWMDPQGLAPGAPLTVTRITTGHSNEVFRVERGDLVLALRRPPRTPLSPTAHDMAREFRVLTALRADGAVPVAEPVALCNEPEVIGAPFYLMRLLDGVVVRDGVPAVLAAEPHVARSLSHALIDALLAVHGVDWVACGLDGFGRPAGYLERQVPRWLGQLEVYKTRPLPEVDEAGRWLAEHTPPAQSPGILHGDYKLDNVMFAGSPPVQLIAVLDWEQATIGDPLVDLGWVLGLWADPGEGGAAMGGNHALAGFTDVPTRAELADRYARGSARDLTHLPFYMVLSLFKLACVMEGSYARFRAGTSDDKFFASLESGVPALAQRALSFIP